MTIAAENYVYYVNLTIIWYFLFVNFSYVILLIASIPDIFRRFKEIQLGDIDEFTDSRAMPPVTALLPAYNEDETIIETIESLLKQRYPNLQIMVVNDGSSDNTIPLLIDAFELIKIYPIIPLKLATQSNVIGYYISKKHPNLTIIDKEHSGKSDSLNTGINACTTPLFVSIDADTILENDAISLLIFSTLSQPHTIAEGGSIYVLNGCKHAHGELIKRNMSSSVLVAMQTCEYLRAFVFGRTGWNLLNGPLILSGALTLFEKQAVLDVGGYRVNSPGEDMEIIVSLHEHMRSHGYPYRIGYNFSAAAWTHVPIDMNTLWSQRDRWHRGLIDSLFHHINMLFNPRYGATGVLSFPFQFIAEFLGPLVELAGYISVIIAMYYNIINWRFATLFFIATWGFATVMTLGTMLISMISFNRYERLRDIIVLLFLAIFESFGYRQILALCRVIATFRYFLNRR